MRFLYTELILRPAPQDYSFSRSAIQALTKAQDLSSKLGDSYVSADHLFLSVLSEPSISDILKNSGFSLDALSETVKKLRGNKKVDSPNAEGIEFFEFFSFFLFIFN